jgi:hypothetical protein
MIKKTPCARCYNRTEKVSRLPGCTTPCGLWFDWNARNVSGPVEIRTVLKQYEKKMARGRNG